ncbi:MAG: elongation factor Ts [Desulfovibrionaceae bacterium]|nr:elongation factor Ts [Desulfovibrionaceae bacterium]
MSITAQMVKDLREKTGAGMMDCKKALVEAGGNEQQAIVYLREKGLAKAAKKAGRATSQGIMACNVSADGKQAVLVEIKCETDFVAKNEKFLAFAQDLAARAAGLGAKAEDLPEDMTDLSELISVLGENLQVGRVKRLAVDHEGFVGSYIHSNGKIGVLVGLSCQSAAAAADERLRDLAKDLAMQVAAIPPVCLAPEQVPAELLETEKAIYKKQAMDEGKPENIAEKIVLGRINKYYKEVCLLHQAFIKDDKKSIKDLVSELSAGLGEEVRVSGYVRLALGEDG